MERMTYSVLVLPSEEIIECNILKVLYKAVQRKVRFGEEFTAYFYKNVDWHEFGFEKNIPFFVMGTE